MQAYDLIMLIVLGMATILGAIKGFAWQVASLASIFISYLVAYRFRGQVSEMIHAAPPWNQFLAMLLLYVGTSFVIWVGFRLLSGGIDKVKLKEFDRHIGAAFGLAKGLIYCLLITMFAMSLLGPKQQSAICQSRSGYYIASALDKGVGILPKEIHDVVGPYLRQLDEKLKNGQDGFPVSNESNLASGLPNLPSTTSESGGQGAGSGWDLGQLIPNILQPQSGQPSPQPSALGATPGVQSPIPTDSFLQPGYPPASSPQQINPPPSYPQIGNFGAPNSIFPPVENIAPPAGNGFSSGNDGYGTQSAQQLDYSVPR